MPTRALVEQQARIAGRAAFATGPIHTDELRAGLALHEGRDEVAARLLRRVVASYAELSAGVRTAIAQRRLGQLLGGDEGHELLAQSDAVMQAQRIADPEAITEMLLPGCWSD